LWKTLTTEHDETGVTGEVVLQSVEKVNQQVAEVQRTPSEYFKLDELLTA